MNFIKESNRIYAENDEGSVVAEVTFPLVSEGIVSIDHTFVDNSLRGQGVASDLMEEVYALLKENDLKADLVCSYAIAWYKRYPEKKDIVAGH